MTRLEKFAYAAEAAQKAALRDAELNMTESWVGLLFLCVEENIPLLAPYQACCTTPFYNFLEKLLEDL